MRQSFLKGENVGCFFFPLQPLHLTVKAFIIGLGRIWVISIDYKFWQVLCQVQKAFINCSLLALLRCNFTFKMSSPLFPRLHVHQQRGLSHLEGKLGHCCFPSNSKKGEVCLFNSNLNYSIFFACFLMGLETDFTIFHHYSDRKIFHSFFPSL